MAESDLEVVKSRTDHEKTISINNPFRSEGLPGIKVSNWVVLINKSVVDENTKITSYENDYRYSDWNFMKDVEVIKYIHRGSELYAYFFGAQSISESLFRDYNSLESILLPPTINIIPYGCFAGCQELKRIRADYVNFIGDYAFQNCVKLRQINFKLIGGIGRHAFYSCFALESVNNLADWCFIDEEAFLQCHNVKLTITLDANLNRGCFNGLTKEDVKVIGEGTANYWLKQVRKNYDLIRIERNAKDEIVSAKLVGIFRKDEYNEKHCPDKIEIDRKEIPVQKDLSDVINPAEFMYNMQYFFKRCRESDKYNSYEKELKEERKRWRENVDKLENSALNGRDAFLEMRKALFGV